MASYAPAVHTVHRIGADDDDDDEVLTRAQTGGGGRSERGALELGLGPEHFSHSRNLLRAPSN